MRARSGDGALSAAAATTWISTLYVGCGELRLDGRARGRLAGRHPRIPYRVHRREVAMSGKIDRRRQDLGLVAAGFAEQPVDLREHLLRLAR